MLKAAGSLWLQVPCIMLAAWPVIRQLGMYQDALHPMEGRCMGEGR